MKKVELEISIEQFLEKWETAWRFKENEQSKFRVIKRGNIFWERFDAERILMKRMTDSLRNTLMENNGEEWI
jgi:hypothetical protein|tara:strand:- start:3341 stop:3556 length:216 start_codon:yes stop_codon:yes gene_type:complete